MIRVRIAPSPTGFFHFGTARTALFNWLFARKRGGSFVLRIEDTDVARNKPEYDADIHEELRWLGLDPDETYRQSERRSEHEKALRSLIEKGVAYESEEPAKDDPSKKTRVVRLSNPNKAIAFHDIVHGDISFNTSELGDFVIARSLREPLYHFAVVVDDHAMSITHVIRGDDHISNTPRQILIQEALGCGRPQYAHIPLILAADRSKMSKRKHDTAIRSYRQQGFVADALVNYLALLGWNPGTDQEIFSRAELVAAFSLDRIQKSGAIFDIEKLRWFNRTYLHALPIEQFVDEAANVLRELDVDAWSDDILRRVALNLRDRINVWDDVRTLVHEGELDYFARPPELAEGAIPDRTSNALSARAHLQHCAAFLSELNDENFTESAIKSAIWDYATAQGRGAVLWPLRYALSGKERSPDPFTIAAILGKKETLARVRRAIDVLEAS